MSRSNTHNNIQRIPARAISIYIYLQTYVYVHPFLVALTTDQNVMIIYDDQNEASFHFTVYETGYTRVYTFAQWSVIDLLSVALISQTIKGFQMRRIMTKYKSSQGLN